MEELIKRSKKVTSIDYYDINYKKAKPNFLNIYEDENERFCIDINNKLLKVFYIFIIQIFIKCKNFEKDEDIDDDDIISESRVPSFVANLKEENEVKIDEKDKQNKNEKQLPNKVEQVFMEKFMNTSKYKSFFINFCQHHEVIDLYKIPYNFFL